MSKKISSKPKKNEPLAKGLWELLIDESGKYQYIGDINKNVNDKIHDFTKYHLDKLNDKYYFDKLNDKYYFDDQPPLSE